MSFILRVLALLALAAWFPILIGLGARLPLLQGRSRRQTGALGGPATTPRPGDPKFALPHQEPELAPAAELC